MWGPPAVSGVRTLGRSRSGGRGWARELYLVPPAEEASEVSMLGCVVFIIRHLDVVPHAVVHHLASGPSRQGSGSGGGDGGGGAAAAAAAAALRHSPRAPPLPLPPWPYTPPSRDVTSLVTSAAALATKFLKSPAHVFRLLRESAETSPHPAGLH